MSQGLSSRMAAECGLLADLFDHLDAAEPPAGRVDPEMLVALVEERLLPEERARVLADLRACPGSRRELMALFPSEAEALLSPPRVTAKVLEFPRWRAAGAAAATLAAAAAVSLFVQTPRPPARAGFEVIPVTTESYRSAAPERSRTLRSAPGQEWQILVKLGEVDGLVARARGLRPGGLLYAVEADGRARLLCMADDGCRSSARTMARLYVAPTAPGAVIRFAFVSTSGPVERALAESLAERANQTGGWAALQRVLSAEAAARGWQVLEQPKLEVAP